MTRTRVAATALATICLIGAPAGLARADGTLSDQDTAFMTAAHQGNLAEIAAGEDAGENATTECVRHLGERLVTDHTDLDESLTGLAERLGVELPDAPTEEAQQQLAEVQAKAGTEDYDKAWLTTQEAAHEDTLALIDQELADGSDPDVKAAAEAARPIVAEHLAMVEGGTCHESDDGASGAGHHDGADSAASGDPAHVPAGHGTAAAAAGGDGWAGPAALSGGVLLTAAGGTAWLLHRRTARH
ncbi:DUF4142 domain-containing protein [Streptomyces sp. RFCAC02]|uniref:DUF4142 domain-containing protein n=1 Tax=Streptomyces sp. RFCAC02 TaxID=2499143 RepID=UPI001F10B368|nr:DUF4142 domain-containing protein [Streptomyces sp. RFCAC02]